MITHPLSDEHTNRTRSELEVLANDFDQFVIALLPGSVRIDKNGKWLSNTDGIGELNKNSLSESGGDDGLG